MRMGLTKTKNRDLWCRNPSAWQRFRCWDAPCKVKTWCMQFQRCYLVHKRRDLQKVKGQLMLTSNLSQIFMWITSLDIAGNSSGVITFTRQSKGCIKINIKIGWNSDVKNTPVKLQNGTCNFWWVIALTGSFGIGLDWKFKGQH